MKNTIYLLVGIIASGKSTWARQHTNENTFSVCKDNIREMIYGKYNYKKEDEYLINNLAKQCIKELIRSNKNVIIDDCWDTINNQKRINLSQWLKTIEPTLDIKIIYFDSITGNVNRRLKDNYGNGSLKLWTSVKEKMLSSFEIPEYYNEKISIK